MIRIGLLLLCMAALLLSACGHAAQKPLSAQERAKLAAQADPALAQATNQFGLALAERVIQANPGMNAAVSPVSMMQALAMTLDGASGATRQQLASVLGVGAWSSQELDEGQRRLEKLMRNPGSGITLTLANSVWLDQGWPFRSSYKQEVKDAYGAQLFERKLTSASLPGEVNDWVNKRTGGRIPTMLNQPMPEPTRFLLLNALYFDGNWENPFDARNTKAGGFVRTDGKTEQVSYLHQTGIYRYKENAAYQAVELPYGEGQMAMIVVLPRNGADRKQVEETALRDPGFWNSGYSGYRGEIALPKFHTENTLKLMDTLTAMGLKLPFDPQRADFSRMADTGGNRRLLISLVLQKTRVEVSEQGTQAAAASLVGGSSMSAEPRGSFVMKADHPFLFAIQDLQSGLLLFVGQVESP